MAGVVAHRFPFQVGYYPSDGDDLLRKGKGDGLRLNLTDADEAFLNAPVALFGYRKRGAALRLRFRHA